MFSARTTRRLHNAYRVATRFLWRPLFPKAKAKAEESELLAGKAKVRISWEALTKFMFPNVPEHYPIYRKLQLAKSHSKWGRYWDVLMIICSLYACALYVAEQYVSTYEAVQIYTFSEITVTQFFAVDFLYNMASAPHIMQYLVAPSTLVDLVTIVPVYITLALRGHQSNGKVVNLSVLRFIRILRLVRILRMFKMLNGLSGIKRQLITLTLTLTSLLFMAAGIMQFMENDVKQMLEYACNAIGEETNWLPSCDPTLTFDPWSETTSDGVSCDCVKYNCRSYYDSNDVEGQPGGVKCPSLTFLAAFYFILVTAATIGYGDITPTNEISKAVVIFIIATTMIVIPVQLNALTTLLSMTSIYRQPYDKQNDDHVIICGYVQDWRKLEEVLKELLHPDRSSSSSADDDLHIVVLSPVEPSEDLKSLFNMPQFEGRVSFLIGSALNMNDLQRARADVASAMFFLCNTGTLQAQNAKK